MPILGEIVSLFDPVAGRQMKHPVYNAEGRQVGSYATLADLCAGRWQVFTAERQPPYAELRVSDFWGRKVPLVDYCFARGLAAPIATPAQRQAQIAKTERQGRAVVPGTEIVVPSLALPSPSLGGVSVGQIALIGGLGLLAVLALRRA